MTDLLDRAPPDGVEVLLTWLEPLGEIRTELPMSPTLPCWVLNFLGGPSDRLVHRGQYSLHTFASSEPEAQEKSMDAHRRICLLAGQWRGQQKVTLSSGQEVYADDVIIDEWPHKVQWTDTNTMTDSNGDTISIYRFTGTYTVPLRWVVVT